MNIQQPSHNLNYIRSNDHIKRSNTYNMNGNNNLQTIKVPRNTPSPPNKYNIKVQNQPYIKRNKTAPSLKTNNHLIRSKTVFQNPSNMKKYEINLNAKDFEIKSMQNQSFTSTYDQQQQYNQSLSSMVVNSYKTFIFYGPMRNKDLIYVGQNPVLKNYFKLRRMKYDELVDNLNKGDPLGFNNNLKQNDSLKKNNQADGFIKVNVSGNIRLDKPEMYKNQPTQSLDIPSDQEKKPTLKKRMFGLFKSKPLVESKRNVKPIQATKQPVYNQPTTTGHLLHPINTNFNKPTNNYQYQPQNDNRNSLKDVDMLLDVALKTYEMNDGNSVVKTNLSPNPLNSASGSPTKSDSWGNLLNQKMIKSESIDDFDFLELYSPLEIKKGFSHDRRISICSTNSESSVMSKNSYRNLSFTNLEKLRTLVKSNEKDEQLEDPVLTRLFDSGFHEIKVFDKNRQKWVIYKDTNKPAPRKVSKMNKIMFSQSIEVFPLPPLEDDSDGSVDSFEDESITDLSEEELMRLKSMKEMQVFQEIKNEVNTYKSQEMLIHKDSILNTHFFI